MRCGCTRAVPFRALHFRYERRKDEGRTAFGLRHLAENLTPLNCAPREPVDAIRFRLSDRRQEVRFVNGEKHWEHSVRMTPSRKVDVCYQTSVSMFFLVPIRFGVFVFPRKQLSGFKGDLSAATSLSSRRRIIELTRRMIVFPSHFYSALTEWNRVITRQRNRRPTNITNDPFKAF